MSSINLALQNKLGETDIRLSADLCSKGAIRNHMLLNIINRNNCDCEQKHNMAFTLPEGNICSDVMFIGESPSVFDGEAHTTFFDANGRLITIILDKLGLKRDNIYITNVTKCCVTCDIARDTAYNCAAKFLLHEINLVKPKLIITLGNLPTEVIRSYILGDDTEIQDITDLRRKVFKGKVDDYEFKIIHTYSPNTVLSKSGSMYNKYKLDIWNDIAGAYSLLNKVEKAS